MSPRSRSIGLFALPLFAAACALAPERADELQVDAADVTPAEVHETWFVELEAPPLARGGDPAKLSTEKKRFRAHAAAARLPIVERYAFDRLWNGVSLHIEHRSAALLATFPGVKAIYPVVPIVLDRTPPSADVTRSALRGHPAIVTQTSALPPVSTSPPSAPDLATAIAMTGADVAQSTLGLTGANVRVGVIDSGVDFDHPDLGGCFGPGCRVAFGHDFVGDDFDAAASGSAPVPDAIPDDCGGHGTHVAGIIGANGAVRGVAPNVIFGAYRVFGCSGTTSADVMLKAMERAEADGMRVVNMSIGSPFQWPDYPTAKAADQLVANGIVVVTSVGNSGASSTAGGIWSAGAPGVAKDVIATASIDNTAITQQAFTASPDDAKLGYNAATGAPPPPKSGTFPLARTGTTTTNGDGCANAPAPGSLTGQVVLIRRGAAPPAQCGFYTKALNAMNAGAAGVILYNNTTGQLSPSVTGSPPITIPVVAITAADGALLDARIAAGPATMSWSALTASYASPTGGQVSSFGSWGLAADLSLKPDLAAPGGSIYSTYPLELGGYDVQSGTSMAAPHVAGAAALLIQARPELPAARVRDLLQNTAAPVAWTGDGTGETPDAVPHQGAGMIHVDAAALAPVMITPGKLSLGESQAGPSTRTLTLTNAGSTAITYDVTHVAAPSTTGSYWVASVGASGFAAVSFGAPSVTVPASGTATIDATITADAALAEGSVYGGYLVFTPQGGGTTLRVPYAGFKGDYQAIKMLTPVAGKGYPWLAKRVIGNFQNQAAGATFTLQSGDVPYVVLHLEHAARRIKLEVLDAVKGKPYGSVIDADYVGQSNTTTATVSYPWDGKTLFNKQLYPVPNGQYVLKLSALKALGDAGNPADWETWTSPVVTLNHP